MDLRSQEILEAILKKEPRELNEEEIAFLKARRSYVKESQLAEYESVLHLKNQTSDKETVKENAKKSK